MWWRLDLGDYEIAAPALVTILMMPLAFSISCGIGLGLIVLSALSLASGKRHGITLFTHGLAAVFLLHFFEPLIARWMAG